MVTAVPERSGTRRAVAVLAVSVVGFAVQQTAIVPAIADVQKSLHASPEWAAWLVTVYLIVATVATLAVGRLADLHGRRRMLLLGLVVFALASVGAALSVNIAMLLAFRALQGIGGAVYPLALSLTRELVPQRDVTVAIGALTGAFGVGTAVGFVSGGLLAEYASWRWIFVLGAVLVAGAAVVVRRRVPDSPAPAVGSFDLLGTGLLGTATVALLTALTLVVPDGWGSPGTVALLVIAALAATGWAVAERREAHPLIDLHVLTERPVLIGNLASVGLGWALFASYLLLPRFARAAHTDGYGLAMSAAAVGFVLVPLAVGQLLAAPAASLLVRRYPTRFVFAAGLLLTTAALGALCGVRSGDWATAGADLLLGLGAGTALQSASAVTTEGVSAEVAAVSASLNSTVRRFAGGIGGQVSTILLASLARAPRQPEFRAYVVAYLVAAALCAAGAALVLSGRPESAAAG